MKVGKRYLVKKPEPEPELNKEKPQWISLMDKYDQKICVLRETKTWALNGSIIGRLSESPDSPVLPYAFQAEWLVEMPEVGPLYEIQKIDHPWWEASMNAYIGKIARCIQVNHKSGYAKLHGISYTFPPGSLKKVAGWSGQDPRTFKKIKELKKAASETASPAADAVYAAARATDATSEAAKKAMKVSEAHSAPQPKKLTKPKKVIKAVKTDEELDREYYNDIRNIRKRSRERQEALAREGRSHKRIGSNQDFHNVYERAMGRELPKNKVSWKKRTLQVLALAASTTAIILLL